MDLEKLIFLSGTELSDGTLLVGAQDDDVDIMDDPHTLILKRSSHGEWSEAGHVEWASAGVSENARGDGISLLGPTGSYLDYTLTNHLREDVIKDVDEEDPPTVFRFCKTVNGALFAGGTDRFLFQFVDSTWREIGIDDMKTGPAPRSFENLCGFGPNELYAFGWDGIVWSNISGAWQQVASPTNLILTDGDTYDEKVFIGGQIGTILVGRGDNWSVIKNDVLPQDIWSVRAFGDAVYFSCMTGILRLKGDELTLIKQLGPDMRTAMSLFVGPSGLWSVGASDIVLFDGDEWHTIAQSD